MAEAAPAYLPRPAPCQALDAIVAEDEDSLPETQGSAQLRRGAEPSRRNREPAIAGP